MTHIRVGNLTIIGSDNGFSPGWRQAINWTNAGILSVGRLGTNFSGILIQLIGLSFKKMRLKVSTAKWRLFCLGINVLKDRDYHLPFLHYTESTATTLEVQINRVKLWGPPVRCGSNFLSILFKLILQNTSLRNCSQVNATQYNL